jgi:hypothetical protein
MVGRADNALKFCVAMLQSLLGETKAADPLTPIVLGRGQREERSISPERFELLCTSGASTMLKVVQFVRQWKAWRNLRERRQRRRSANVEQKPEAWVSSEAARGVVGRSVG